MDDFFIPFIVLISLVFYYLFYDFTEFKTLTFMIFLLVSLSYFILELYFLFGNFVVLGFILISFIYALVNNNFKINMGLISESMDLILYFTLILNLILSLIYMVWPLFIFNLFLLLASVVNIITNVLWMFYGKSNKYNVNFEMKLINFALIFDNLDPYLLGYKSKLFEYSENYEGYLNFLNDVLTKNSSSVWAFTSKGFVYNIKEDYNLAIENFNKALEVDSNYADAWFFKAVCLKDNGDYEEALDCVEKALDIKFDLKYFNLKLGIFINLQEFDEFFKFLNTVNEEKYTCDIWMSKSWALLGINKIQEVLIICEKGLKHGNYLEWSYLKLIILIHYVYEYDAALSLVNGILEDNSLEGSRYSIFLIIKGEILLNQYNFEGALNCVNDVLKKNSNEKHALTLKANIYYGMKDFKNCMDCFNKLIELDNDVPSEFIKFLIEKEEFDDALELIDKRIQYDTNSYFNFSLKAEILANLSDYEESKEFFNKAVELDKFSNGALISKANVLAKFSKFEEALAICDEIDEDYFNIDYVYFVKGNIYKWMGNKDKALFYYEKTLAIDSGYVEAKWEIEKLSLN